MNKIFKVVWSKVKHCYVVVSEIAKNTTSGGARRCRMGKVSLAAAMAAAVLTGSFAMPNSVWAADAIGLADRFSYIAIADNENDKTDDQDYKDKGYILTPVQVMDENGLDTGETVNYWVQEGYVVYAKRQNAVVGGGSGYVVYKVIGAPKSETFNPVASIQVHEEQTSSTTVINSALEKVTLNPFGGVTNAGGVTAPPTDHYVLNRNTRDQIVLQGSGNATEGTSSFYDYFKTEADGLEYIEATQSYVYNNQTVNRNSVYFIGEEAGVFVIDGKVYDGVVYGNNGETLLTGQQSSTDGKTTLITYWGAEIEDYNLTVAESGLTVGNLKEAFDILKGNDDELSASDVKEIKITPNDDKNGGNVDLLYNDAHFNGGVPSNVSGTLSFAAGGGTSETGDTYIRVSQGNTYFDLQTGSRVVANPEENDYEKDGGKVESIAINGIKYDIGTSTGGTGTMSSWTAKVGDATATIGNGDDDFSGLEFNGEGAAQVSLDGNKITISATDTNRYTTDVTASKNSDTVETRYVQAGDNAANFAGINFKEGSNISLELENKTITINATDTKVVSGSVVEGGSGLYNIDLQTNASTNNNITIRNLHDYYTTKATASNVGTNGANVHFDRNDNTNEYDLTFVGNGSATVSVDDNGRVVINADDKDTVTNLVAGHNVSFAINDPVIDENGNRTYTINATNTYTVGTSISGNDLVFNRNDGDSFAVNFIAGGGAYNKTTSKYEDTYVQIGGKNGIKLNTGSQVVGAGVQVVGSTDKALSGITINGENFKVPVIQANENPEGETPQYYLTSLKIDNTLYGIVSEGSKSDLSVTKSEAEDGSYTANNGIVELKMVDNYTGQASNQKIVIKDVASKAVVDEILKVKFGVTDTTDKTIGLYKPGANGGVNTVLSEIAVSSIGGDGGNDVQIKFGGDDGFALTTGSIVSANDKATGIDKGALYKLAINGEVYNVATSDSVTSSAAAAKTELKNGVNTTISSEIAEDEHTIYAVNLNDIINLTDDGSLNVGSTVKVKVTGIEMGNQKITGLAAGEDDDDAVNFGQLKSYVTGVDKYLVSNPDAEDAKYTVDNNSVTLKVKNGKDVVINGIASKTELDTLAGKVENAATEASKKTTVTGSSNITVTPAADSSKANEYNVALNNDITLTTKDTNDNKVIGQVAIKSSDSTVIVGIDNNNKVSIDGANGIVEVGENVSISANGNAEFGNVSIDGANGSITGLNNITWTPDTVDYSQSNKAATEAQLHIAVNKLKSDITTNISELNNLSVTGGEEVNGKYHGWQLKDSSAKDENSNTVTKEYSDTTLDTNITKVTVNEDGIRTLTVADTAGNSVVLDDIASASVVQQQIDDVNSTLVDHSTIINNHSQQIDNLSTTVNNHSQQIDNLSTTVNNHSQQIDNLSTTVNNHSQQIDNLSTTVNNHSQQINDLSSVVNTHTTQINNIDNRVSDIETNITNITGNQITSGNIANYQYDAQTGGSSSITLVTESNRVDDIVIAGLRDTTLVANGNNEGVVDADNTFGKTYTISDTNKNSVVLKDVASASKVSDLAGTVGAATKESLKESYKNTTYLQATKAEDGKEVATESLVEADVKLDKAIKDNADLSIQNDLTLQSMINNNAQYLDSRINQLGSKVNKVGAGAAALAALHPMDFDPDDKLSFAVGAGNYAGETATALGAFYRPNEKVMMNVAGTYGNGENMVNMGVSFALDRTNNVSNSRTAMAREIVDLREQVATQGQQIAQLVALVNQLAGVKEPVAPTVQPFPDVPANHWAYEYLNNLVAMGVIEGYPDGTFGGDRTMTRYEFATMLFKAMQNGAVLSEQIRQEFNAELGRIRVDRIKGADDDANKIERVRVNNYEDRDDYGSKIVMVSAGK